jgi:hypothetical protein
MCPLHLHPFLLQVYSFALKVILNLLVINLDTDKSKTTIVCVFCFHSSTGGITRATKHQLGIRWELDGMLFNLHLEHILIKNDKVYYNY